MNSDSESILFTIKKMLGLDPDYDPFDLEIKVHINAAFAVLRQLGVGPKQGFRITGNDESWDDFVEGDTLVDAAKEYIYLKVRCTFDPPAQSSVAKAMEEQAEDAKWRLVLMAEGGEEDE